MTRDEVLDLIWKLKMAKFPGPDGIHLSVPKELRCEIVYGIHIWKLPLYSATVPKDWRVANVPLTLLVLLPKMGLFVYSLYATFSIGLLFYKSQRFF